MLKRSSNIAIRLVALAMAALAIPNANTQTEPVFRTTSEVVMVPASVLDKHNRPVTGLKREEFELHVDGKPVRIKALDVISGQPPATITPILPNDTVTNLSPVEASRNSWTILLVDLINTSLPDRMELRKQLMKFLAKDLRPGQQIAIYALSGSLVMLHPFTGDTKSLIETASRLLHEKGTPTPNPGFVSTAPTSVAGSIGVSSGGVSSLSAGGGRPGRSSGGGGDIETFLLASQWREAIYTNHTRAANTLAQFRQLANSFAGVVGKKTVLWLTGDASPLNPTLVYQIQLNDQAMEPLRMQWSEIAATYEALNGAGISVFPVDIRGIINPGLGSGEHTSHADFEQSLNGSQPGENDIYSNPTARRQGEAGNAVMAMETAAAETGGMVLKGSNDLGDLIGRAQDIWSSYYVLTFTPEPAGQAKKAAYHKIEVKVPGRHAQVLFRRGYVALPEAVIASDEEIKRDLVDAASSPVDLTAVPLTLKLIPAAGGNPSGAPSYILNIRGDALQRSDMPQGYRYRFSIFMVLKDSSGKVISTMGDKIDRVVTSAEAATIARTGFLYPGKFETPSKGRTFGRIVVRDNLTGHVGTITVQLTRD